MHHPTRHSAKSRASRCGGFSLLEVLVACGILVLGLTSIAAMIPAAGARLSEATSEDRAGTCAANAYAEIVNRGLAASDLFSSTTKACAFGQFPGTLVTSASNHVAPATSSTLTARIDGTRGFFLEDDLTYGSPTTADTPNNLFLNGGVGPREYKEGICWAAMLTPNSFGSPVAAGDVATLSIAVFKKPGGSQLLTLTPTSGLYTIMPNDDSTRKTFAKSCSYLLLIPTGTTPKWQRVNASWIAMGTCFLTFTGTSLPSGTITAIGFENLLRLDERSIVLD